MNQDLEGIIEDILDCTDRQEIGDYIENLLLTEREACAIEADKVADGYLGLCLNPDAEPIDKECWRYAGRSANKIAKRIRQQGSS